MEGKYERRKSKCDKKKKRDVYRHSSRRRYEIDGSKKCNKYENSESES